MKSDEIRTNNENNSPTRGSRKIFDTARLYHVAICVRSVDKTAKFYEEKFDIGPFEFREVTFANATFHGKPAGYRGKRAFAKLGPVILELVEHVDGETIHKEFLDDKGEGLHHLGFEVNNLAESIAEAESRELCVTQGFTREDGSGFAYLDSDKIGGAIFEIAENKPAKTRQERDASD